MHESRSAVSNPRVGHLIELLEQRADDEPTRPLHTFLVDGEDDAITLTHGELRNRARAIAALLQEHGAEGGRALLLHPPGLDYIAAFFGCLYAGVTAVPAYPPDPSRLNRTVPRLQAIVRDADASLALTTTPLLAVADAVFAQAPDLERLHWIATDRVEASMHRRWRPPALDQDTLAFLQYTSGSTSMPKGVQLTHANLLDNLEQMRRACRVDPTSVLVSWLPPYHDMGLIAFILEPLYSGSRSILMSPQSFLERPLRWLQAISRYRGTSSAAPNFGFDLCVRRTDPQQRAHLDLSSLGFMGCGGEPVRADTAQRFLDAFAPHGLRPDTFQPLYGLAEATLFVSGARQSGRYTVKTVYRWALERNRAIEAAADGPNTMTLVGCGRPLAGNHVVVADPSTLKRCRTRQIGEVWVAGASVSRGYWGRSEVTDATFGAFLAGTDEGPFLRTGDLGFIDDDELFITGRLKDLIIINGANHYAEDIELTAQASNGALRRGCGAAFSIDDDGHERLVLVQEVDTRQRLDADAVAGDIRQALAEQHQLSAHAVVLIKPGSIPKTSSGKIQRHVCRSEFLKRSLDVIGDWDVGTAAPPRTHASIEALLIAEVAAELGRAAREIDPNVAITRYGPDSLAAYNLAHRIETATGLRVDVGSVLDGVTIRQLAKQILDPSSVNTREVVPVTGSALSPTGEYPLSHGQEALWFLHELAPDSSAYHMAQAARIVGQLSVDALQTALRQLGDRHPALRTTFTNELGRPRQRIHDRFDLPLTILEGSGWTNQQLDERLHDEAYRSFDLERGPLMRVVVCQAAAAGTYLVISVHHIVTDLWSLALMVRELGALYSAALQGKPISLPPLQHHYVDYVSWQATQLAGSEGQRLWSHWQKTLAHRPAVLDVPTDHPRPPLQTFRGTAYTHKLDRSLTAQLSTFGQAHDATLFMTLLTAFQVVLYKHSGQSEFLVGTPTAGRTRPEWAEVIGYFVNPIALTADLSADPTFETLLASVRRTVIDALSAAEYPLASLVEKLHPARDPSRSPLFQVMFALQNTAGLDIPEVAAFALGHPGTRLELGDLHLESYPLRPRAAQLDLTLMTAEVAGELCVSWQYSTDLFDAPTIERMAQHFETLLSAILTDATVRVSELPILTAAERRQLLIDWNRTEQVFDKPRCIHQLFEEQVGRTPQATAITCGSRTLTFAELDGRANQLAHYLHELGVGPEIPVAIFVERSVEMLIGLLGILKAGGAYLPLDPSYPGERLRFMLADSEPPVLLTQARLSGDIPEYEGTVVLLDSDWPTIAHHPGGALQSGVIATNLAYILYTSGSTGRPKGVMNTHGAVCNCLLWLQDTWPLAATDHLLQITPLTFDISVPECFWPLIAGAQLTLVEPDGQRDARYLAATMGENKVTVLSLVPSALRLLLEEESFTDNHSLRLVLCSGEELRYELNQRFFARTTVDLYNLYGPTEASIWATFWKCRPGGVDGVIPIGRPISNVQTFILDEHRNHVPVGVPGELYIGGAGLARGYLGRPALTDERFIENPFAHEPRERLYKTGDLVRYRADGNIEFLGRLDHQVKIRGHRIELNEIESVLSEHIEVSECAVLARADAGDDPRLVAYVVARWESPPKATELRAFLQAKLPEYMLPSAFVMLNALPLTTSGKLDRKGLPAPGAQRPDQEVSFVAPRNAQEFRLCELWGEVLGIEMVGIYDDFFDLGGDSLRAAQLTARIAVSTKRDASVKFVLQHRTVATAAAALHDLPLLDSSRAVKQPAAAEPASPTPFPKHIEIQRRPLLSLFASGRLEPVQAAALASFPTALIDGTGVSRRQVIEDWCEGLPLFSGIYETEMGRIATVLLPRFSDELYTDREELLAVLIEALQLAGRLGARMVSLTGLIPSATDYGRALLHATSGLPVPAITTGHATTAATVVLSLKRILAESGRDLAQERVAFLGLGSIGAATLAAMLELLPHPEEILLCDLAARRAHLSSIEQSIQRDSGYRGRVRVLESQSAVSAPIYEATLIIGATNVADVLDVDRLQPGTLLVDDSAPHCFNASLAIERLTLRKDILFTEGGILRSPRPLHQLRYVPRSVEHALPLLRAFDFIDPHEITGCVLSSVLSTNFGQLPPTIGLVDGNSCAQHYRTLVDLGFEGGALRCGGMVVPQGSIQAFRSRFGR